MEQLDSHWYPYVMWHSKQLLCCHIGLEVLPKYFFLWILYSGYSSCSEKLWSSKKHQSLQLYKAHLLTSLSKHHARMHVITGKIYPWLSGIFQQSIPNLQEWLLNAVLALSRCLANMASSFDILGTVDFPGGQERSLHKYLHFEESYPAALGNSGRKQKAMRLWNTDLSLHICIGQLTLIHWDWATNKGLMGCDVCAPVEA